MDEKVNNLLGGEAISTALDPHRRRSITAALDEALDVGAGAKTVALLGFQAATFFAEIVDRVGKVVIVENRRELVERFQRAIVARELGNDVELIDADPSDVTLDERVDVAMYLPRSAWMMETPDAAVLANIRRNVLHGDGTLIPRRVVQLLELADPPTELGGVSLREPRYSRPGEPVATLSESKHFMTTDFGEVTPTDNEVDDTIIIRPLVGGTISGLRLTSVVELAEGVVQASSESGVQSIIVPLREDVDVEAGQPVSIRVRYQPGAGLETARFSARLMPEGEDSQQRVDSDHPVVTEFQESLRAMMGEVDKMGRGADLDRVVSYTRRPHGDVTRLTALFWGVDEEFRRPLRNIVEEFRRAYSEEFGQMPTDEAIYDWMYELYEDVRSG